MRRQIGEKSQGKTQQSEVEKGKLDDRVIARHNFVQCPGVPEKIKDRDATVRERARSRRIDSMLNTGDVEARSLTVAFPPVVSHASRKWDTLVGHFIVVSNIFNPVCPAVPPYLKMMLFCPIRLTFVPCPAVPEKRAGVNPPS